MADHDLDPTASPAAPDEPAALVVPGTPGIVVADAAQCIVAANPTLLRWLGYSLTELTARSVPDICAPGSNWPTTAWERLRREGRWEGEILLARADGRVLSRHLRATAVRTGSAQTYVIVVSDPAEYDAVARAREAGVEVFAEGLPAELHQATARALAFAETLGQPGQPEDIEPESIAQLRAELMRIAELHRHIETRRLFTLRNVDRDDPPDAPEPASAPTSDSATAPERPLGLLDTLGDTAALHTYAEQTLLMISRAIEDELRHAAPGGLLLVCFQRLSLLLPVLERYRYLSGRVARIHIWALPDAPLPGNLPSNIAIHPLRPTDPLLRTWLVLALAPDFWSAVVAEEVAEPVVRTAHAGSSRRFHGGWTTERAGVEAAVRWIANETGLDHRLGRGLALPPPPSPAGLLRQAARTQTIGRRLLRHVDLATAAQAAALAGQQALAADNARLLREEAAHRCETERFVELQRLLSHSAVHDLRGGLTVALGSLDLLLSGRAGPLTDRQRSLAQAARDGGRLTAVLAQTVLDVARLEAGSFPLTLTPLDAAGLARLAEEAATPRRVFEQEIVVRISEQVPTIRADHTIVSRLLGNLLDYAIRYAAGARVDVEADPADGGLELTVRDHGPGLPEDVRAAIPRAFAQADVHESAVGGGPGLAFCRLAVSAHGGTIHLQSPEDGGARFVACLPANQ